MTTGNVQIVCSSCGVRRKHQAKGLCQACYSRSYRRLQMDAFAEIARTEEEHGPAVDYECHDCHGDAEEWVGTRALCSGCLGSRLVAVRWQEKRIEAAMARIREAEAV